ncbi:MAG: CopG family transcriptional regulator [Cyanobacteria bacterium P01_F01_bin.143]
MSKLSKKSTIYFKPEIHHALTIRAESSNCSVSELVDEAVRLLIQEDQEDLETFSERANEPEISYEELLEDLKQHGKI